MQTGEKTSDTGVLVVTDCVDWLLLCLCTSGQGMRKNTFEEIQFVCVFLLEAITEQRAVTAGTGDENKPNLSNYIITVNTAITRAESTHEPGI